MLFTAVHYLHPTGLRYVCSMKHFYSCKVKFQWIIDAALAAYSELKPWRTSLPTQTLIPWLFGHNYRTRTAGPPLWLSWWNICLQCGRSGFDPWFGKSPWRRERLPTPVFWPGEFHGLYSPWGHKDLDMTSNFHFHFHMWKVNFISLWNYSAHKN